MPQLFEAFPHLESEMLVIKTNERRRCGHVVTVDGVSPPTFAETNAAGTLRNKY